MNILVIGNGFDLAHGLPTKYTDFLDWISIVRKIENLNKECDRHIIVNEIFNNGFRYKSGIKKLIIKFIRDENKEELKEITDLCNDNVWIDYFFNDLLIESDWIDFENEISRVIQSVDKENMSLKKHIAKLKNKYMDEIFHSDKYLKDEWKCIRSKNKFTTIDSKITPTFEEIIKVLKIDLLKFIRLFEIYVSYVMQERIIKQSPDIINICADKIISFNYTSTFENLYGKGEKVDYDYIHGKADINNTLETNNMVLGIDEYLPEDRRNKDTEFIAFKKYYQRIHKQTGSKYKDWADQIKEEWYNETEAGKAEIRKYISKGKLENPKIHNLYIFGHSLDITDKDILRDLILNDNVYTTIYYQDKEELGRKIANLVKVIGQDELIRRTGGSTKKIEFKQQQDMVEINS